MIIQIHCISLKNSMVKALKRNQIIIFAIALMLITAGYLSYTMNTEQIAETSDQYAGIGDARLVSNDNVVEKQNTEEQGTENRGLEDNDNKSLENTENKSYENKETSAEEQNKNGNSDGANNKEKTSPTSANSAQEKDVDVYFSESRLERNKMYSELLETYQAMLANSGTSVEQKNTAQMEISNINKQKNAIMIAENLIKNKGFKDVIIFVNNESVSAVVRADNLETADIAQVQNIIQRELKVNVENIHISNIN